MISFFSSQEDFAKLGVDPDVLTKVQLECEITDIKEQIAARESYATKNKIKIHEKREFAALSSNDEGHSGQSTGKEKQRRHQKTKVKVVGVSVEEHWK